MTETKPSVPLSLAAYLEYTALDYQLLFVVVMHNPTFASSNPVNSIPTANETSSCGQGHLPAFGADLHIASIARYCDYLIQPFGTELSSL